jgi:hypothetical protein
MSLILEVSSLQRTFLSLFLLTFQASFFSVFVQSSLSSFNDSTPAPHPKALCYLSTKPWPSSKNHSLSNSPCISILWSKMADSTQLLSLSQADSPESKSTPPPDQKDLPICDDPFFFFFFLYKIFIKHKTSHHSGTTTCAQPTYVHAPYHVPDIQSNI